MPDAAQDEKPGSKAPRRRGSVRRRVARRLRLRRTDREIWREQEWKQIHELWPIFAICGIAVLIHYLFF